MPILVLTVRRCPNVPSRSQHVRQCPDISGTTPILLGAGGMRVEVGGLLGGFGVMGLKGGTPDFFDG